MCDASYSYRGNSDTEDNDICPWTLCVITIMVSGVLVFVVAWLELLSCECVCMCVVCFCMRWTYVRCAAIRANARAPVREVCGICGGVRCRELIVYIYEYYVLYVCT